MNLIKTYWRFANRRMKAYFRKLEGDGPPYSSDDVINEYRFTNCYRASDRVSQKLIEIQYDPDYDDSPREVFFRTMLFKLFNKLETWERIVEVCDPHSSNLHKIVKNMRHQKGLYSAAYIQASPAGKGVPKAKAHFDLIGEMIEGGLHKKIQKASSLESVFELMKSVRSFGDFLAFQYTIDLNYSRLVDFDEDDFVVPGPGALDGISKILPGYNPIEAIEYMTSMAPDMMKLDLFGRELHLIDCQNLFCEISKYTRITHPELEGVSGRTKIKHHYRPLTDRLTALFPPKWGLGKRNTINH